MATSTKSHTPHHVTIGRWHGVGDRRPALADADHVPIGLSGVGIARVVLVGDAEV